MRILWLDLETTSLDKNVANVREIAYIPEIDGEALAPRSFKVRPLFHKEGPCDMPLADFIKGYNHDSMDPKLQLRSCVTPEGSFHYARSTLTFNLEPPHIIDPMDWVGPEYVSPSVAIKQLYKDMKTLPGQGRWLLAGQNIQFDIDVLEAWTNRALSEKNAAKFRDLYNCYYGLDTLPLIRWLVRHQGVIKTERAACTLGAAAEALGFKVEGAHTALADITLTRNVALKILGAIDSEKLNG